MNVLKVSAQATVYEQGRRVHGWQLLHDLFVDVAGDFAAYWAKAQAERR